MVPYGTQKIWFDEKFNALMGFVRYEDGPLLKCVILEADKVDHEGNLYTRETLETFAKDWTEKRLNSMIELVRNQ